MSPSGAADEDVSTAISEIAAVRCVSGHVVRRAVKRLTIARVSAPEAVVAEAKAPISAYRSARLKCLREN
jgi:hypothetical protein